MAGRFPSRVGGLAVGGRRFSAVTNPGGCAVVAVAGMGVFVAGEPVVAVVLAL